MPFETSAAQPKRIAVIGGGISGLGAAYMLMGDHRVVLFEAENRLGGHARTMMAGRNGDMPVDTGFLVFNHVNYPYLTALFHELAVPTILSDMSFGASIDGGWLEYGILAPSAVLAQKRNLLRPQYYKMLSDIMRFNRDAQKVAENFDGTISDLIDEMRLGSWFREYYLYPLSGAIWSTPKEHIGSFPAQAMIRFFKNHALMATSGQHEWYTVKGGSKEYVQRMEARMMSQGVDIRLGTPIQGVRRTALGVEVKTHGAEWEQFDEVIFATHSDDSLAMLTDPAPHEQAALGAVKYQPNDAILHCDTSIMPKRKAAWASWVYTEDKNKQSDRIDLTYWINLLQSLPRDDHAFVTLNTARTIREEFIYDQTVFRHPVFDHAALAAQDQVRAFNGTNRTWFCGAWMKNGFHEDGLGSAVDVVNAIQRAGAVALAAE